MVQIRMSLKIHKLILDSIVHNNASVIKYKTIGSMYADDIILHLYHIVKFLSLLYTQQKITTVYGQIFS